MDRVSQDPSHFGLVIDRVRFVTRAEIKYFAAPKVPQYTIVPVLRASVVFAFQDFVVGCGNVERIEIGFGSWNGEILFDTVNDGCFGIEDVDMFRACDCP